MGAGLNPVETFLAHIDVEGLAALAGQRGVALTGGFIARVDFNHFTGFGIFERDQADFG